MKVIRYTICKYKLREAYRMRFNYTYKITYGFGQCYDSGGANVILSTEQGKVRITGSRKGGTEVLMDADWKY